MNDLLAYAPLAEVVALLGVAVIAYWQLHAYREDAKKRNTLDALTKYSLDPTLHKAKEYLWAKTDGGNKWETLKTRTDRTNASGLLNYLEVIAHGYQQNYFDRETVEKEFKDAVLHWGDIFLGKNRKTNMYDGSEDSFPALVKQYEEWKQESGKRGSAAKD